MNGVDSKLPEESQGRPEDSGEARSVWTPLGISRLPLIGPRIRKDIARFLRGEERSSRGGKEREPF